MTDYQEERENIIKRIKDDIKKDEQNIITLISEKKLRWIVITYSITRQFQIQKHVMQMINHVVWIHFDVIQSK